MKDLQTFYTEYETTYSEPTVRSRAREDGERGIPRAEDKGLSPYESEIVSAAQLLASKVASECRSELESIDAQIRTISDQANRALKDEEKRIADSYQANRSLHENSHELAQAKDLYEQTKKRFDIMFSKVGRMPLRYVPHWLYVLLAFLIFGGEIPLNAMVFQIFGENQVMTWIMAFVIGLSIPLSAHFVGIKAREHQGQIHWPNIFKALLVLAMVVIALYGLAEMRHDYLSAMREELGLSEQLVETSYLFFWLNVAVFMAAILVSYLAHDPVPGYERLHSEYAGARKRLAAEEKKKADALKWIEMARVSELDQARKRCRESLAKAMELRGKYDQVLIKGKEQEERCLHLANRDISVYRHENLRSRKDYQGAPAAFSSPVSFPLALKELPEKLLNSLADGADN